MSGGNLAQNWGGTANHRQMEEVAAYFGDVLVASAYDLLSRKSTGKNERKRQLSILAAVHDSLSRGTLASGKRHSATPAVVARAARALKEFPA